MIQINQCNNPWPKADTPVKSAAIAFKRLCVFMFFIKSMSVEVVAGTFKLSLFNVGLYVKYTVADANQKIAANPAEIIMICSKNSLTSIIYFLETFNTFTRGFQKGRGFCGCKKSSIF